MVIVDARRCDQWLDAVEERLEFWMVAEPFRDIVDRFVAGHR